MMTLPMTLPMTSKLYTEKEIGCKRVIEIRILDLIKEKDKQKSFSLYTKKNSKGDYPKDYHNITKIKNLLEIHLREVKR